jgi:gamma-glutamylcyclotransferase (GGCT)/AIG2-like uncharacterized protein YtfP
MAEYLFVYGTLRKNYDLKLKDRVKDKLQYVGQAKIGAALYDLGRYPGAVKSDKGQEVIGDVFLLRDPDKVLRILDKYEGIPEGGEKNTEFVRKKGRVQLRSGQQVNAWIYWYNADPTDKIKIKHKNYLNYLKNKSIS